MTVVSKVISFLRRSLFTQVVKGCRIGGAVTAKASSVSRSCAKTAPRHFVGSLGIALR